ncbi:hypothetical protein HPB51_010455 [Rhipicephalus microplus]|uniref:Uncharacterized protein n=1 Tax=Rhipicephalus microplus TaxID=6941 RepID=A0A9J6E114_RHIMP|nr:hypothetical protein HPB51_010455 [Rhipicephalus microplus]
MMTAFLSMPVLIRHQCPWMLSQLPPRPHYLTKSGSGGTIAMTPTHHTPLSFVQLLVMACCSCGAITNASAAMTATRAHRFGNIMAGPSSSFWKASSARLVGDSMRVRPWNPPSGPPPLLDDYAGERLCHPMTTSAGHSLASDAVHQQWCLAPAALPVRPPTVLRMLRPGPRALAISTRDCTYINRRDIIAAFTGSGGPIAMTPTHHTPLSFVQPFNEPVCDDLREKTVLRSGRTLQQPAAPATVAMASDLATAGPEASALPAGVLAKPQGDSTDLASQTVPLPRDAVHAPLDFSSGTIAGATSVPLPEDRRNSSPVAASELCTVLQAIATSSQRLADATVTFSAACARTALPPPSCTRRATA